MAAAPASCRTSSPRVNRASWVANTYITNGTQAIAANANEAFIAEVVRLAKEAGTTRRGRGAAGGPYEAAVPAHDPAGASAFGSGEDRRGGAAGGEAQSGVG